MATNLKTADEFSPSPLVLPSEEIFRLILDRDLIVSYLLTDASGQITNWSKLAERQFGFDEAEMVGNSCFALFPTENQAEIASEIDRVVRERQSCPVRRRHFRRKDQTQFEALSSINLHQGSDGPGVIFNIITHRTDDSERELSLLASCLESVFDRPFLFVTIKGKVLATSEAFNTLVGESSSNLSGLNLLDNRLPWKFDGLDQLLMEKSFGESKKSENSFTFLHDKSEERSLVSVRRFRHSGAEEDLLLLAVDRPDVSNASTCSAERALELGDLLFESSSDCMKIINADGRVCAMNIPGQCQMEIQDFSTLVGRKWASLWPAETRPLLEEALLLASQGEKSSFRGFCPTAKGTPKWWEVDLYPLCEENGEVARILSVSHEIKKIT